MMGVDVDALVKECTGKGLCPFANDSFKCPQTIECSQTKASNGTKHLIKSERIRTALQRKFPKIENEAS